MDDDYAQYVEVEETSGPGEVQYVDEDGNPCDEQGNAIQATAGPSFGLALPAQVTQAFKAMNLPLPAGFAAPKPAARPAARPAPKKVIQVTTRPVAAAPAAPAKRIIKLPAKAPGPQLVNGDSLSGAMLGASGMLGGELQANGADLLFSASFTAVAGVWGGSVTILRPGICTMWDISAQSGDYDQSWLTSITLNTFPWTIPAGSQETIASFSYRRNFVLAPKVAFVSPGWSLIVAGASSNAANVYRFQGFGIASPSFSSMDSKLLRYIHRNAHDEDIRRAVLLG